MNMFTCFESSFLFLLVGIHIYPLHSAVFGFICVTITLSSTSSLPFLFGDGYRFSLSLGFLILGEILAIFGICGVTFGRSQLKETAKQLRQAASYKGDGLNANDMQLTETHTTHELTQEQIDEILRR